MKNSSDTIWNRTRDLPACSAVHQPTAPRRVPSLNIRSIKFSQHAQIVRSMKGLQMVTQATAEQVSPAGNKAA